MPVCNAARLGPHDRRCRADDARPVDELDHRRPQSSRVAEGRVPAAVRLRRPVRIARRQAHHGAVERRVRRLADRGNADSFAPCRHRFRHRQSGGVLARARRRCDPREHRRAVPVQPLADRRAPVHRRLHVGSAASGRGDPRRRRRHRRDGLRQPVPGAHLDGGALRVSGERHPLQQPAEVAVLVPRPRAPRRDHLDHSPVQSADPAVRHREDSLHHRGRRACRRRADSVPDAGCSTRRRRSHPTSVESSAGEALRRRRSEGQCRNARARCRAPYRAGCGHARARGPTAPRRAASRRTGHPRCSPPR